MHGAAAGSGFATNPNVRRRSTVNPRAEMVARVARELFGQIATKDGATGRGMVGLGVVGRRAMREKRTALRCAASWALDS